ncbi:MAG: hypothetical protein AB8B87_05580 [Granulosicoccus sp.]
MTNITYKTLITSIVVLGIAGCGSDVEQPEARTVTAIAKVVASGDSAGDSNGESTQWTDTTELDVDDILTANGSNDAELFPDDIPYPLYPNGSRYRIGGEGDLKIVLFQTEDSFEDVDAYYQKKANMARLSAMSDYVRYSADNSDIDPWETSRPGIVIHQFNDASEREAVGADGKARTNIIMSFE